MTDSIGKSDNNLIAFGEDKWQQDWAIRVPASSLASIAVSPDGQLAAVSGTTYVRSNGETSRAYIYIVSLPEHKVTKAIPITEVGTLAWTADGKRVAIAGGPGIELVDFFTEKTRRTDDLKDAHRMSVRFTSDGLYCVESVENGATGLGVRIWDGQHRKLIQTIAVGEVGSIAVSNDGRLLAIGERGRTTIWQLK